MASLLSAMAACQPACGFVLNQNSSGKILHWNLTNINSAFATNIINRQTRAIRYFIAQDAFSENAREQEINAVRACFDQWQAVPGTILKFEYAGTVKPLKDINTSDKTNTVFWKKGGTSLLVNGELDDITGRHAVTYNSFSATENFQREVDIVLNGVEEEWFTDFAEENNPHTFVDSVLLHEIGHFIGLEHSPVGGASLFVRTLSGVSAAAGLSEDEIAAARFLYPAPDLAPGLGVIRGKITLSANPVLGAMVFAEDRAGNILSGTVTRAGGQYQLQGLAAGTYLIRVCPLDPAASPNPLVTGADIAALYAGAETQFRPATEPNVPLSPGGTNVVNFALERGRAPFHIGYIRLPTTNPAQVTAVNAPVTLRRGASQWLVGVFSSDLPAGAALSISGDGLSVGQTTYNFKILNNLNLLSTTLTVAPDATPGLRTLFVEQGGEFAFANGFLEILPDLPDYNFDGLDDRFQRKFFPLFTSTEAAPAADPDLDAYSNLQEFIAGTRPNDSLSLLKIERITRDGNGITFAWQSGPGRSYQVFAREPSLNAPWLPLGPPVTAAGLLTEFFDPAPAGQQRFYRVQALP